jgi:hypothetical protein
MKLLMTSTQKWTNRRKRDRRPGESRALSSSHDCRPVRHFSSVEVFFTMPMQNANRVNVKREA